MKPRTKIRKQKKITLNVPEDLLLAALEASGDNITATIVRALELLAASQAYSSIQKMKGKVKLNIDLEELREDRKW